ncbi:MAG: tRNA (N6-isopentenyl adenosine(37)-C2)-methylthiotransferase MiaB [Candidatus Auribacterota bacterium]|nr:tRNA (N6-isopentenyl adenosine(37)-C2)-methylthiotransferase MiaB [Candidatus Auribacterota bacterium]
MDLPANHSYSPSPPSKRFYLRTFGCQMNQHDSEIISGMLSARGWSRTKVEEEADLILLNTCSVRRHAEERVLGRLARYRKEKEARPELRVGVIGCMAQIWKGRLRDKFPELDLIMGPGEFARLGEEVESPRTSGGRVLFDGFPLSPDFFHFPANHRSSLHAWVTVIRGCNNFCSYCVVPYARGREISRPTGDIIDEVRSLGKKGYKEVTLLGQNVNSYRGGYPGGNQVDFAELLKLLNPIAGIERIRFVTSHPKDISPGLVSAIAGLDKVCESIHFPAQSGSDAVLKRMRRGYTRDDYMAKVRALKSEVAGITLASDFIVGFPGESDDDFTLTLELLREVRFDRIFAFSYSPRPKTLSAQWPDDIPPEVKSARLQELLALQRSISLEKNQELLGYEVEVLVEGRNRKYPDRGEGRTRGDKRVFFPWVDGLEGRLVKVRIERVTALSLFGIYTISKVKFSK